MLIESVSLVLLIVNQIIMQKAECLKLVNNNNNQISIALLGRDFKSSDELKLLKCN